MRLPMLAAALLLPGIALASGVQRHETMSGSPRPYDFNHRSAYNAAALQEQRYRDCGCRSGSRSSATSGAAVGAAAGGSTQVTYSYAIGNWTQIDMTLGSNANGMINSEEHQNNWGNETATMNIDSQNAEGDQTVNNGGEWSGEINDQIVGNDNATGGASPAE